MSIQLQKDEFVVDVYDYSRDVVKKKGAKSTSFAHNLIITNQRIVNEIVSKNSVKREEIPVREAAYLTTSYARIKRPPILLILGIIGIICAIGLIGGYVYLQKSGEELENMTKIVMINSSVSSLVMAIVFFCLYHTAPHGCRVIIKIAGTSEKELDEVLSVGAAVMTGRNPKRRVPAVLRVTVNRTVAEHMVNNIGASILNAQFGVRPTAVGELVTPVGQ